MSKYARNKISSLPWYDTIDLRGQKRAGSLAHEAFHDIQGYLLDYHPEVFDALLAAVSQSRESIVRWYNDPHTTQWRTDDDYQLMHIFPRTPEDVPYRSEWLLEAVNFCKRETGSRFLSNRFWGDVYAEIMKDLGRVEAIPVLLAAAAERNKFAGRILSRIFGTVGLNADFYDRMPLLE